MAHDHGLRLTQRIHQSDDVAGELKYIVRFHRLWTIGLPVAAHIGRNRMKAGFGERR